MYIHIYSFRIIFYILYLMWPIGEALRGGIILTKAVFSMYVVQLQYVYFHT